jgi:thioester reductase-like protein
MAADLELEPEIAVNEPWQPLAGGPVVILLTGVTGFLGAYLLRDLLAHTAAHVICLVRAESPVTARTRIEENLRSYGLAPTAAQWCRVEALPGDLTKRRLGLTEKAYDELTARTDTILHGGAAVNFYQDYRRLRGPNVGGVREILRFAVQGRTKALHYVSSTGVFDSEAYRGLVVTEADVPAHCHGSVMGYTQTKWVAEQLVLQARVRGVPASVYRSPFIMGDARSGVVDAENLVVKMLIGSIQGGYWPDGRIDVEMIPVDALSRAIVHFARDPVHRGRIFHLTSPQRMQWADIGRAARTHGYALELVPYEEWNRRLAEFGRRQDNALRPLVRFYTKVTSRAGMPVPEIFARVPRPVFDSTVTQAALAEAGLVPPGMTAALFATYLDYFVAQGWLGSPAEVAAAQDSRPAGRNDSRPPYAALTPHA